MRSVSEARREAFIDAPIGVVWDLIRDIKRHPEWWPRVVEIGGDAFEQGSRYRQVTKKLVGHDETELEVEELENLDHLAIRCLDTGTFVSFLLTEAQGGTFLESRMGMDPKGATNKVFDALAGPRYFRNWLQNTVEALDAAARERAREVPGGLP
jgi:uncharacterized protein YndB with AHSA1/START domain